MTNDLMHQTHVPKLVTWNLNLFVYFDDNMTISDDPDQARAGGDKISTALNLLSLRANTKKSATVVIGNSDKADNFRQDLDGKHSMFAKADKLCAEYELEPLSTVVLNKTQFKSAVSKEILWLSGASMRWITSEIVS